MHNGIVVGDGKCLIADSGCRRDMDIHGDARGAGVSCGKGKQCSNTEFLHMTEGWQMPVLFGLVMCCGQFYPRQKAVACIVLSSTYTERANIVL